MSRMKMSQRRQPVPQKLNEFFIVLAEVEKLGQVYEG